MKDHGSQIIFVAGLSGSGKSTAMAALEDLGYYGVDNLPAQLVGQFVDLCSQSSPPIDKVALAVDTREEPFLRRIPAVVEGLRNAGNEVRLIFLDCEDEVLESRYRETRRVHPLSPAGTVREGIARERDLLSDLVQLADLQVDTSSLNIHQLKEAVLREVLGGARQTIVNLVSFGFRFAAPRNAEHVIDVRILPNPYFDEQLRPFSGQNLAVARYVLESDRGAALLERLQDLLSFFLPLYDQEGKAYVTLAIGCTGGRHRSVAMVEALSTWLKEQGREVNVEHRDIGREG